MGERFRVDVNFRPPLTGLTWVEEEAGKACEEATEASAKGSSLSIHALRLASLSA